MIRINLLPEEYRKKARTPIKLILGLAGAVAANAVLVAWWSYSYFGVQAEIESEASVLQLDMDGLTPQVNYYRSLETESKQYKSREETLSGITQSRVSWTRKLDELIDVCNRGGNGTRHLVWFDDLQVTQSADPKAKTAGTIKAAGHSGSDKFAQVANFLEDLEASPFISDFHPPAPPEGSQTQVDEELIPSIAWSFPLALTLKTVDERAAKADTKAPIKGKPQAKPAAGQTPAPAPATPIAPETSGTPAQDSGPAKEPK